MLFNGIKHKENVKFIQSLENLDLPEHNEEFLVEFLESLRKHYIDHNTYVKWKEESNYNKEHSYDGYLKYGHGVRVFMNEMNLASPFFDYNNPNFEFETNRSKLMHNCQLRYKHSIEKPHIEASFHCHDMFKIDELYICEDDCGLFSVKPSEQNLKSNHIEMDFLTKTTNGIWEVLAYEDVCLKIDPSKVHKIKLNEWNYTGAGKLAFAWRSNNIGDLLT